MVPLVMKLTSQHTFFYFAILSFDINDYFSQLIAVGGDLVGAVTVKAADNE